MVDDSLSIAQLVHKVSADEILVRGYERQPSSVRIDVEAERFTAHRERWSNLLATGELLRQSTILSAHALFDVPLGWAFLMDRIVVDLGQANVPGRSGEISSIHVDDVIANGGGLRSLTSTLTADSNALPMGRGYLRVVDPRTYARMRAGHSLSPLADGRARRLGRGFRLRQRESTGRSLWRWELDYDTRNAHFFDHPSDHVPGMLLVAALRAAVLDVSPTGWDVDYIDASFVGFVELDQTVAVVVDGLEVRPGSTSHLFRCSIVVGSEIRVNAQLRVSAPLTKHEHRNGADDRPMGVLQYAGQEQRPHIDETLLQIGAAGQCHRYELGSGERGDDHVRSRADVQPVN